MGEDFKVGDRVVVENYPQMTALEKRLEEEGALADEGDLNGLTGTVVEDEGSTGYFLRVRMDDPEAYVSAAKATIDAQHGLFRPSELARVH